MFVANLAFSRFSLFTLGEKTLASDEFCKTTQNKLFWNVVLVKNHPEVLFILKICLHFEIYRELKLQALKGLVVKLMQNYSN